MAQYKIYAVKNDDGIQKLLDILTEFETSFEFFDFKEFPPTDEQLKKWAAFEGVEYPINERSTFVKKNRKNFQKLTELEKYEWLRKNNHIILRPVIEDENDDVLSIGGRPERLLKVVFGFEQS